jgi:hypothetical protein
MLWLKALVVQNHNSFDLEYVCQVHIIMLIIIVVLKLLGTHFAVANVRCVVD